LRAFLRQDPNIIMVGEIRDAETAELAVQAALTGHLVLATLHTNTSAGAMPRLIDMGIEPFLLSSTVEVVVGQRLVRKICDHCKEAYYAEKEIVEEIHKILDGMKTFDMYKLPNNNIGDPKTIDDDKIVLYRGKGCPKCNDTGYDGRLGIFEALDIDEKVSKLVLQRSSSGDIAKVAIADGMITMPQDGFMKALEGITTIEEVLRVQQN
jgi:type II secretory ATPase GspE/PulE/Tfp pilus assembly ATPase PilB-like protein